MSTTAAANGRLTRTSLLTRVKIRDYKSIAYCDVGLGPLTVLVGRNGSGKSNFLDALRFTADVLRTSFYDTIVSRGGPGHVWRRGMVRSPKDASGPPGAGVELELGLGDDGRSANYGFDFGFTKSFEPVILGERLAVKGADGVLTASYDVSGGELTHSTESHTPPMSEGRLYLASAAGLPAFRDVYDAVLGMNFYHLDPRSMREKRTPNLGGERVLSRDGSNLAGMIRRIGQDQPWVRERILGYLSSILPGLVDLGHIDFGLANLETVRFDHWVSGLESPCTFFAEEMSDGTLLALGTLVAVFQRAGGRAGVRLVGIEEPETALHPAAAAVLMDALREGTVHGQVIVTTHSPDLLDLVDFETDRLLVAERDGETRIAGPDQATRQTIKEQLFSAGQLLSMDYIEPDWRDLERQGQEVILKDTGGAV